ncbi:MAG: CotH kinase family protein [Clostridia bacterium]|nr:CotH kinase family protein [Clostridia bacterium]
MKRSALRIITLLLSLALILGCFPGCQSGTVSYPNTADEENGDFTLWVSPSGFFPASKRPFHAVKWQYNENEGCYYLYCPTEGDLSKMQIWFSGAKTCSIAGQTIKNGKKYSIAELVDKEVEVLADDYDYELVIMKSANIGSMYITTESGSMDYIHLEKGNEELGSMRLVNADGKEVYEGDLVSFRGRGNATWKRPKKSYQIQLAKKTDLVGEGAGIAKTWILLANYGERSLIRNTIAYDLSYDAGMTETPRSNFVDLYCNGEYMGNYQLSEKVQIGENRININDLEKATEAVNDEKLGYYFTFGEEQALANSSKGYEIPNNPDDITGGYLLELEMDDRYEPESSGFVTSRGQAVVIKEPEKASREQVKYISNFFQEFEDAVFAEDGINPKTGKRFDEYFDLTSLARKYILEEFVKNFDADKTSQFYYKPADSESTVGFCGPVWDQDNSFDNFKPAAKNDGMYAANNQKYIYYNLCKQEVFMNEVKRQWKEDYLPLIRMCVGDAKPLTGTSLKPLTYYYELLSPSAAMNFTLYDIIDTPIFTSTYVDTGSTYEEHIEYLDRYMTERAEYLSGEWLE